MNYDQYNYSSGFFFTRFLVSHLTPDHTRLEKQRRADEEAEQLRHIATENFAANRARTAARREREHNRPNIIQQSSPSLEIKAINPSNIIVDNLVRGALNL